MGKWADRLDREISRMRREGTDKTDETPVLSVLSVPRRGISGFFTGAPDRAPGAYRPWTEAEIGRFVERVALFMRRGVDPTDADDLAERLLLRDRDGDDRRLCIECAHCAGRGPRHWRCTAAAAAGGVGAELGALAVTPQRCPAYRPAIDGDRQHAYRSTEVKG